jgi:hypothetical protein
MIMRLACSMSSGSMADAVVTKALLASRQCGAVLIAG